MTDARALYDGLTDDLLYDPAVGRSTMMGYPCVRRAGRFFASFDTRAEALIVKLPGERVADLIADGTGEPVSPNGREFREWVTIPEPDAALWGHLLEEARAFAAPERLMAEGYDEQLADRIRQVLSDLGVDGVREQKMFGGIAFLVGGHVAVAASRDGGVLLSVDRGATDALLGRPHTRPMVMRGREMAGWLRVDPHGVRTKRQLVPWVKRGIVHAGALPPK
ncbi:MAG TPA: TfoX/Sxy family protein [Desertimonas sp.]|nr:TfoX/Sxy family protein [Desertimonas sp.]